MNLNIKKLQNEVAEREQKKIQTFEKVLDNCYSKILQANSKTNDCNCLYTVPLVLFGVPIYNLNDCIKFIMDKLSKKGFKVYFTYPNLLLISWKPEDTNQQTYLQYDIQNDKQYDKNYNTKPLLDYQVKKDIQKLQKNFKPISDYREEKLFTNFNGIDSLDSLDNIF
jgi:hypothetical protein